MSLSMTPNPNSYKKQREHSSTQPTLHKTKYKTYLEEFVEGTLIRVTIVQAGNTPFFDRETEKSSVENLVPIPSEFKGIYEDICDMPSCDYFDAEFGLINSLLSRDISIASPKIDFLPEEFAGELDFIDPILPGIDEDDFDEEEGEIDNDILQIEDEILREKLLNINLLINKIEALNLTLLCSKIPPLLLF
ncbi:hypothetical protein Tco_1326466 [Tanacetum coccineum]